MSSWECLDSEKEARKLGFWRVWEMEGGCSKEVLNWFGGVKGCGGGGYSWRSEREASKAIDM